jgi:hypothetical protein
MALSEARNNRVITQKYKYSVLLLSTGQPDSAIAEISTAKPLHTHANSISSCARDTKRQNWQRSNQSGR